MSLLIKIFNVINVVITLTLLLSCDGNDVTKGKDTETPQGLNSLIGTEWVHSDDTDPESKNWFNVYHSPEVNDPGMEGKPIPAVIKFLADGRISEPVGEYGYLPQYYRYSYNEPYVTVVTDVDPLLPHPLDANIASVEEIQKKWNLCSVTIDEPWCDSSKCKNSKFTHYCNCRLYDLEGYWFLGKVEGDTMHLQQYGLDYYKKNLIIERDIYLIRRK